MLGTAKVRVGTRRVITALFRKPVRVSLEQDLAPSSVSSAGAALDSSWPPRGPRKAPAPSRRGTARQAADPAIRADAVIRRVVQLGEVKWVVKNPETTKYYNFDDDEWGLIAALRRHADARRDPGRVPGAVPPRARRNVPRPRVRGDAPDDGPSRADGGGEEPRPCSRRPAAPASGRPRRRPRASTPSSSSSTSSTRTASSTARSSTCAGSGRRPVVAVALVFAAWTFGVIADPLGA